MRAIRLSVFLMGCAICGAVSAQTVGSPTPQQVDQWIQYKIRLENPMCRQLSGMFRDAALANTPNYVKERYLEKIGEKLTKFNCWR